MISIISVLGVLFAVFIPGFFVTWIFFREIDFLQRMLLSATFSIMVSMAIGIALGYNESAKIYTGGITPKAVWTIELSVTTFTAIAALAANMDSVKKFRFSQIKDKFKIKKIEDKEQINYKKL